MRKVLTVVLMLSLVTAGLMIISCASEEKEETAQGVKDVTAKEKDKPVEAIPTIKPVEKETTVEGVREGQPRETRSLTPQTQTRDVLSGNPINRQVYADYSGKRIYFCCAESKRRFDTDPESVIERCRQQGVTLEDTPAR